MNGMQGRQISATSFLETSADKSTAGEVVEDRGLIQGSPTWVRHDNGYRRT